MVRRSTLSKIVCNKTIVGFSFVGFLIAFMLTKRPGFETDISTFHAWALRLADKGTSKFYEVGYFSDYFPLYLYVLLIVGKILKAIEPVKNEMIPIILKLPAILAYLGTAIVCTYQTIAISGRAKGLDKDSTLNVALIAAALFLNPAMLYNAAVFGQVDTILVLLGIASLLAIKDERYYLAVLFAGLNLAFKPLAVVPSGCVALLLVYKFLVRPNDRKKISLAFPLGIAAMIFPFLPFWAGRLSEILPYYATQFGTYPYVGVNAFNLYGALGWNWHSLVDILPIGLTKGQFAWTLTGIGVLGFVFYCQSRVKYKWKNIDDKTIVIACSILGTIGYLLVPQMHERYFFAVLPLLFVAALDNRKAFQAMVLASIIMTVDQMAVVDVYFGSKHSIGGFSPLFIVSFLGKIGVIWLLHNAIRQIQTSENDQQQDYNEPENVETQWTPVKYPNRKTILGLGMCTLFAAITIFTNLGSLEAPQSRAIKKTDLRIKFATDTQRLALGIFVQKGKVKATLACATQDESDENVQDGNINSRTVEAFKGWRFVSFKRPCLNDALVLIEPEEGASVGELTFIGSDEATASVAKVCAFGASGCTSPSSSIYFDEPETSQSRPDFQNETYFDEIYYVRSAEDVNAGQHIYEQTHPHFGKSLIALSMKLFGDNPFAWRLPGAIAGVLFIPVVFLIALFAFGSPTIALIAAAMSTLELSRITMSRIATIDITVTFFILCMHACVLFYLRKSSVMTKKHQLLSAGCIGLFLGLALATKWVAAYAGLHLILLLVALAYVSWQRHHSANRVAWELWHVHGKAGLIAFIFVPTLIYLLSYLHPMASGSIPWGLQSVIDHNFSIFRYHSAIVGEHTYSSSFYEWPWNQRPLLLFQGSNLGQGIRKVITLIGHPIVWAGIPVAIGMGLMSRKRQIGFLYMTSAALAQILPWMLVTRSTFPYHYLPVAALGTPILASAMYRSLQQRPKLAATTAMVFIALFITFFPITTGMQTTAAWVKYTKWFDTWLY